MDDRYCIIGTLQVGDKFLLIDYDEEEPTTFEVTEVCDDDDEYAYIVKQLDGNYDSDANRQPFGCDLVWLQDGFVKKLN